MNQCIHWPDCVAAVTKNLKYEALDFGPGNCKQGNNYRRLEKNGAKCGKKLKKWQPMLSTGITFGENIVWDYVKGRI